MNELPLVALGGMLASSHCIGMCGPFAVIIGMSAPGWTAACARQAVYSLGRLFTYSCAGAIVGYGGLRFVATASPYGSVQAVLCVAAGALLVLQGLSAAQLLPLWVMRSGPTLPCGALRSFSALLRSRNLTHVFLGGLVTGFLPCGLVYAYLALAASTADVFRGWATMAAFGAGTIPAMVLAGAGGRLINVGIRQRVFQIAACCVIVTGALTIYRGAYAWSHRGSAVRACPYCEPQARS
jgi:sulfite exporter TauE/SafE